MNDTLPEHLIHRQEAILHLFEDAVNLELPSKSELQGALNKSEPTNQVIFAVEPDSGRYFVVKRYVEDPEKGAQTPAERAGTELSVLKFLAQNGTLEIVTPDAVGEVKYTVMGEPVTAQTLLGNFISAENMKDNISVELTKPEPANTVAELYSGISALHKIGVAHGDLLFGENIGVVQVKGRPRTAFIDFELSKLVEDLEPDEQPSAIFKEDLVQFTANLLATMPKNEYPKVRQKLATIIGYNYDPSLLGLDADQNDVLGNLIVEQADKRNEVSKKLLVYG